jgi:hypothetical protein
MIRSSTLAACIALSLTAACNDGQRAPDGLVLLCAHQRGQVDPIVQLPACAPTS